MDEVGIRTIDAQPTIAVRLVTTPGELKEVFDTELPGIAARMEEVGAIMVGPPFARYRECGPDPQRVPDPADWLTEVVWPLDG